jgi:two-component system, NarL family, sensor kinase
MANFDVWLDEGFPEGIYWSLSFERDDRQYLALGKIEHFDMPGDLRKIGRPAMKPHKLRIDPSSRIQVRKWPRVAREETGRDLYWLHAPELLFGIRASHTGQFVYECINPAFEDLLGISSEDIREREVADCLSDEDAKTICEACDACLAQGRPVRYRHRLALGGRQRKFETMVTPVRDPLSGSIVRLVGSHLATKEGAAGDAGERASARHAAANLDVRLLSLQEEVHQRIASDLHDSTCQHLIAATLNVMRMKRALNDIGSAERLCDDIDASINQALKEIRSFTYLLHPQNLHADGLKTTIEQFVDGFSVRTSLRTSLEIAPEVDKLSYERQRAVLRVIQEALTNVFRHAKATLVQVAIKATPTHLKLRISDNGRGMPIDCARSGSKSISSGVGIPAMRARLQQMGAALEIRSSSTPERRGTTLCAAIPHAHPRKTARLPVLGDSRLGRHRTNIQQH